MRVTVTNRISGTRESYWISWEQYENKLKVDAIEDEMESIFRQFNGEEPKEPAALLKSLSNIDVFTKDALNHIFRGEVSSDGSLNGYHHEGIRGDTAKVIPGSKSSPDKNGVYSGRVMKEHCGKILVEENNSSFFPRKRSPQRVVDEINYAYKEAKPINPYRPTILEGVSSSGVTIRIIVHKNTGKIKNAFPIKEG